MQKKGSFYFKKDVTMTIVFYNENNEIFLVNLLERFLLSLRLHIS